MRISSGIIVLQIILVLSVLPSTSQDRIHELTMKQAVEITVQHNLTLQKAAYEIKAKEAGVRQEGLPPNPELEWEMENVAGTGSLSGIEAFESALLIGQTLELGGKRKKRVATAKRDQALSAWDYKSTRLDVLSKVKQDYIRVWLAQESLSLALKRSELAEQLYTMIAERVKAGKVSSLDEVKARIERQKINLEIVQSRSVLMQAKRRLAAHWCGDETSIDTVQALEPPLDSTSDFAVLQKRSIDNPDRARWEDAQAMRETQLTLAKANAVPDLTVAAGVKYENESDDMAFVAAISLPLPLVNRNQGEIQRAAIHIEQSILEQQDFMITFEADLFEAFQNVRALQEQVKDYHTLILPDAQKVFDATEYGYRQGKLNYLDVLDAQRTLFESQEEYMHIVAALQIEAVHLERLVGSETDEIQKQKPLEVQP